MFSTHAHFDYLLVVVYWQFQYYREKKPDAPQHAKAITSTPYASALHVLDKNIDDLVLSNFPDDANCSRTWREIIRPVCEAFLKSVLDGNVVSMDEHLMHLMMKIHAMGQTTHDILLVRLKPHLVEWSKMLLVQYVYHDGDRNAEASVQIQKAEAQALLQIQHISKHLINVHLPPEPSSHIEHTPEVKALLVFIRRELDNTLKYNILMERLSNGTHDYYTLPMITTNVHSNGLIEFIPLSGDRIATYVGLFMADGLDTAFFRWSYRTPCFTSGITDLTHPLT
jgi:hypothetical protein